MAGLQALFDRLVSRGRAASDEDDAGEPDFSKRLASLDRVRGVESAAASRPTDHPAAPAEIEEARLRAIVFRVLYPPPAERRLSFYGGLPIGPADLEWPRAETKRGPAPLHFVMQWDCGELAAQDNTGLLPRDGALYLFMDLEWGDPIAFRFLHIAGRSDVWEPIAAPGDLGRIFGDQGAWLSPYASPHIEADKQDVPRRLPRWPFKPVAIDYPPAAPDEDEDDEPIHIYWNESDAVSERLLAAQASLGAPLAAFDPNRVARPGRPFPAFPHDWAAVRVVCAEVINTLRRPDGLDPRRFSHLDDETRQATSASWKAEAERLYDEAVTHNPAAALTQQQSDEIWAWIEKVEQSVYIDPLKRKAVNVSLGLGSEAINAIPAELIAENSTKHALALDYVTEQYAHELARENRHRSPDEANALFKQRSAEGGLKMVRRFHAPTPNHMFGPPSYVQGDVEESLDDHVLLLELSGKEALGFELGEGVLQFMIRPDALRASRFDEVRLVTSAY